MATNKCHIRHHISHAPVRNIFNKNVVKWNKNVKRQGKRNAINHLTMTSCQIEKAQKASLLCVHLDPTKHFVCILQILVEYSINQTCSYIRDLVIA